MFAIVVSTQTCSSMSRNSRESGPEELVSLADDLVPELAGDATSSQFSSLGNGRSTIMSSVNAEIGVFGAVQDICGNSKTSSEKQNKHYVETFAKELPDV